MWTKLGLKYVLRSYSTHPKKLFKHISFCYNLTQDKMY